MAYLALYRKYRPNEFGKIIGQDAVIKTLTNQIKEDKIGHAYLFCGARGTGKTSVAKIFAKAINCENSLKDGSACGKCKTCLDLSQKSSMDILEIDAASNNRVDEIRDLREKVQYPPVNAKYKVYIIDEVHMLSDSAFNALLKTLEEPPKHAVFILATTEVHKLPATILSRCMRFDFRLIATDVIFKYLKTLFKTIEKPATDEALMMIAKAADGSLRDALSISDICVSYNDKELTYEDVLDVLGSADEGKIEELARAILEKNVGKALLLSENILALGKSVSMLGKDVAKFFRELCVMKTIDDASNILAVPKEIFKNRKELVKNIDFNELSGILNNFAQLEGALRFSSQQKTLFETCVIKSANSSMDYSYDGLLRRVKELEDKLLNCDVVKVASQIKPIEKKEESIKKETKKEEPKVLTNGDTKDIEKPQQSEENTEKKDKEKDRKLSGKEERRIRGIISNGLDEAQEFMMEQSLECARISGTENKLFLGFSSTSDYNRMKKDGSIEIIKKILKEKDIDMEIVIEKIENTNEAFENAVASINELVDEGYIEKE